jgi:hypothetical protein
VIPEATDFWRSHIVRVLNWKFPSVVKAFIKLQERERMAMGPGGELRIVGRRLNRRRANLILTEYSYQEATELLDELRS